MKNHYIRGAMIACTAFLLNACGDRSIPDVSHIPVSLTVQRFEKDFFNLDTLHTDRSLDILNEKYPDFLPQYITQILGLDPKQDSAKFNENLVRYIRDYRPIYDSCALRFKNTNDIEKIVREALQRVKYYFPGYPLPAKLITFVGPMDAIFTASLSSYSDILTENALGTGLQLHLGPDFSFYHTPMGEALYPDYITRRFSPETISVNAIKNIIDDIYPEQTANLVLVEQMVEKGKRLYLLDQFMPLLPDTLKIGYTSSQWKGCLDNEGRIWNYFVTNNLLMSNDPMVFQRILDEGPQTPDLGEGSPGYIGLFVGRQIVYAYIRKNAAITPEQLLRTPARTIYEGSKYRPK
jgi:hypothetical protein